MRNIKKNNEKIPVFKKKKNKIDGKTETQMIKDLSKQYYGDKRIKSIAVKDDKTGNYIGVNEHILKTKGKRAALNDAKNESSLAKSRTAEVSYLDKLYDNLLTKYDNKEEAFDKAVDMFHEVSGYSKSTVRDLHKKYSSRS